MHVHVCNDQKLTLIFSGEIHWCMQSINLVQKTNYEPYLKENELSINSKDLVENLITQKHKEYRYTF